MKPSVCGSGCLLKTNFRISALFLIADQNNEYMFGEHKRRARPVRSLELVFQRHIYINKLKKNIA